MATPLHPTGESELTDEERAELASIESKLDDTTDRRSRYRELVDRRTGCVRARETTESGGQPDIARRLTPVLAAVIADEQARVASQQSAVDELVLSQLSVDVRRAAIETIDAVAGRELATTYDAADRRLETLVERLAAAALASEDHEVRRYAMDAVAKLCRIRPIAVASALAAAEQGRPLAQMAVEQSTSNPTEYDKHVWERARILATLACYKPERVRLGELEAGLQAGFETGDLRCATFGALVYDQLEGGVPEAAGLPSVPDGGTVEALLELHRSGEFGNRSVLTIAIGEATFLTDYHGYATEYDSLREYIQQTEEIDRETFVRVLGELVVLNEGAGSQETLVARVSGESTMIRDMEARILAEVAARTDWYDWKPTREDPVGFVAEAAAIDREKAAQAVGNAIAESRSQTGKLDLRTVAAEVSEESGRAKFFEQAVATMPDPDDIADDGDSSEEGSPGGLLMIDIHHEGEDYGFPLSTVASMAMASGGPVREMVCTDLADDVHSFSGISRLLITGWLGKIVTQSGDAEFKAVSEQLVQEARESRTFTHFFEAALLSNFESLTDLDDKELPADMRRDIQIGSWMRKPTYESIGEILGLARGTGADTVDDGLCDRVVDTEGRQRERNSEVLGEVVAASASETAARFEPLARQVRGATGVQRQILARTLGEVYATDGTLQDAVGVVLDEFDEVFVVTDHLGAVLESLAADAEFPASAFIRAIAAATDEETLAEQIESLVDEMRNPRPVLSSLALLAERAEAAQRDRIADSVRAILRTEPELPSDARLAAVDALSRIDERQPPRH